MQPPKKIMIVDDDKVSRDLLKAMLEIQGHRVVTAENGINALEKIDSNIDLFLLDVMMPWMDGFELAGKIRDRDDTHDIPIIMVTALKSREDRLKAVEVGANDYITKPVDKTELRIRTTSILKMKEAQDAIKENRKQLEAANFELNQIFNASPDGMWLLDREFRIIRINEPLAQIFGLDPITSAGKKCNDLILCNRCAEGKCPLNGILKGEKRIEYDTVIDVAGKGQSPFIVTGTPFYNNDKEIIGIIATYKNISERKRAEEERLYSEKLQSVLELAGAVCHNLNQPMQSILGFSELILMDMNSKDPIYDKLITINEQISRMGVITQKLMKINSYEVTEYINGRKIIDIEKAADLLKIKDG